MRSDDLAMQGPKESSAMDMTWFSRNIPVSVPEGFKY